MLSTVYIKIQWSPSTEKVKKKVKTTQNSFKLQGHQLECMKKSKMETRSIFTLKYFQNHLKNPKFAYQTYLG